MKGSWHRGFLAQMAPRGRKSAGSRPPYHRSTYALGLGGLLLALQAVPTPDSPSRALLEDPVIAAAGDIACTPAAPTTSSTCHDGATAHLLSSATRVLTLGDNQYENGTLSHFQSAGGYQGSWGAYKGTTSPVPGNHEYHTSGAAGYFDYFGVQPYYSYDVGAWHLVALNSSIPVAEGSPQNTWLERDLAASPAKCSLTYFHHPRYSAGKYAPGIGTMKALWVDMLAARVDVTLAGHDHQYQRWAPMNNAGGLLTTGVRQFVVGTGGKSHYPMSSNPAGLQASNATTFGVLRLTLHATSYDWAYVTETGQTLDSGSTSCQ